MNRNNILLIFCDQFRIDLIGCYGSKLVRTPNIDALAAEGTLFDRAYTPTPLCSPARASLMSGMYPHGHHMFNNSTSGYSYCQHPRPDLNMLPAWFRNNTDFETGYFGKWHIGTLDDLAAAGFDHVADDTSATGSCCWKRQIKPKTAKPCTAAHAGSTSKRICVGSRPRPDIRL